MDALQATRQEPATTDIQPQLTRFSDFLHDLTKVRFSFPSSHCFQSGDFSFFE
jgi:hypothetical protein